MSDSAKAEMQKRTLFQTDFPPEEFAARRARIFEAIGPTAHAVLQGAPAVRGFQVFRQSNEFYYCCGVEVPHAYLLMNGRDRVTSLFLPRRQDSKGGETLSLAAEDCELIKDFADVDAVYELELLAQHLKKAAVVYTPHSPAEGQFGSRDELVRANRLVAVDPWNGSPTREQHFLSLLMACFPHLEIRDLSPIIDALRVTKSPREIRLLRRAGHLSALAITEAIRATKPGVLEYQLGAVANFIYMVHGARGEGYRSIIASGKNIWDAHYFRNNCVMNTGDLVLMDTAPDCGNYTSDIARMWPVNGTYAPWQRELYGFIVEYHKNLLQRIRPGLMADQVMDEAASEMAKVVEKTRFSKPIYEEAAKRTLEFRGHLSHSVGMTVHDVGNYRSRPLRPGVVFSLDPQMWVPEERLYFRVEDTIVVTDSGIENLTAAAPLELDEIEATMRKKGLFPPLG